MSPATFPRTSLPSLTVGILPQLESLPPQGSHQLPGSLPLGAGILFLWWS